MEVKRHFSRVPFKLESTLTVGQTSFDTMVIDISLKGALITKPEEWSPDDGQDILLVMKLADSDILMQMQSEVAHEHEDKLGLRFVEIDVDSLSHLRRLLELNLGDAALINKEVTKFY